MNYNFCFSSGGGGGWRWEVGVEEISECCDIVGLGSCSSVGQVLNDMLLLS